MCSAVDVTPLVVEYDTARLSDCHGFPAWSATPLHASTTGRPRWYTPTAPPLPDSATWASRIATTSANAGSHVPCATAPTLLCACAVWHLLRSEEHTSELQSQSNLVCRLLLEKKKVDPHQAGIRRGSARLLGPYPLPDPSNRSGRRD